MKKYIIIAIAAVAVFCSCGKDFLTEAPKQSQSNELTLSYFEGIDLSTAGAYAPLASNNWYGAHFILDNEMGTGNGKRWGILFDDYESGRYTDEYAVNYTANSTSPLWSTAYYVISAANNVLNAIKDNGMDSYLSSSVTEQDIQNLRAECLFLRAFSHFDLVRTYAMPYSGSTAATQLGVPYVTVSDSELKPARETMANTYKYIVDDLIEAESIIDPAYKRSGTKDATASVNLQVIQAMLARVYLYSEQWQNAADYANKVITSGKYSMWTPDDLKDAAVYRVDVPSGGEVIFEVYNNVSGQSYGTGNENVWGMTSYTCYGDCGVSSDLTKQFEDGDIRATLYGPDPDGNAIFTYKYLGKGLGSLDANNVILLRLSEMYLIRAEAVVNGASGYDAVADLKTIADNRGATAQPATKAGVYAERAKELAWEGHLWFDLARTGRPMTRTDIAGQVVTNIPAGDNRWAKPIPSREFSVNPNLEQNDGYSKE